MSGKSSVSVLQEYCAKNGITPPKYDWIESSDGSFICLAEMGDEQAYGNGRSKRDAKHLAAANLIKVIRRQYPDIDEIPQVEHTEMPTIDMITTLRDYCVQHQHPLPTFEIIQQGGTPDAPEFVVLCTLASIKRFGVSEKKKDARQKAAYEMFNAIKESSSPLEHEMQVVPFQTVVDDVEAERYRKFKTYRELTESDVGEMTGVLLSDRHNYFKKFHKHLKDAAHDVLNKHYELEQLQAMDLFSALKITPRITYLPALKSVERIVFIQLNCDYDAAFADVESKVYRQVLDYFRDMLV